MQYKCWHCTAKSYSLLAEMNKSHLEDCPCFFCVCPKCNTHKNSTENQGVWVTEDGLRIPIKELEDKYVVNLVETMKSSYDSAMKRIMFDKKHKEAVLDQLRALGPGSIFSKYAEIKKEFKSRGLKIPFKQHRPPRIGIDIDMLAESMATIEARNGTK